MGHATRWRTIAALPSGSGSTPAAMFRDSTELIGATKAALNSPLPGVTGRVFISFPLPPRVDVVRGLVRERRDALNCHAQFREIMDGQPKEGGDHREPDHPIQEK